jgi:phosphotransferase system HPr (HPr) family protein
MFFWKTKRGAQPPAGNISDESHRRQAWVSTLAELDLRGAAALASVASDYRCKVRVRFMHREADATSIFSLLCLAAGAESELILEAIGPESDLAIDRIEHLNRHGFDIRA